LTKYEIYNKYDAVFDNKEQKSIKRKFSKVNKEIEKVRKELNTWCEEYLSKQVFYAYKTDRIIFEREIICDVAYFFKKKRYLCHVIDDDGKKVDKLKYRGIALRKSAYPAATKHILKEVYERTIKEKWEEADYFKYLDDQYEIFQSLDFNDISIYKNLNSYKESEDFLRAQKGTTGHGKAALFYNQLIEKMNLRSKYYFITNSSKIRQCYIDPDNQYKINVMGFSDEFPTEFKTFLRPNYKRQFELTVLKPLSDFIKANRWSMWTCDRVNIEADIMEI